MSKQTRTILWPITIILFLLGIWPIALILLITLIFDRKDGVKMSTGKVLLVIATVLLFATGIWPVGIAALIALVYLSREPMPQKTADQRIQELEAEN